MYFKFRRGSITANNDTAPVNGIGLNTPDGVKYLSGESGALQFGGEAIGGGGGGVQIVVLDMETMTASHSASDIIAMLQTAPVFACVSQAELNMSLWGFCNQSPTNPLQTEAVFVSGDGSSIALIINEDKSVTPNS